MKSLNRLRVRLTLLYFLVAICLVGIVGVSSYTLLNYYFTQSNDTALRFKMAVVYAAIGIPLPTELESSLLEWEGHREEEEKETPLTADRESEEEQSESLQLLSSRLTYEGELSSIFIFPLDEKGTLVFNPNPFPPPMDPDRAAVLEAMKQGVDIRTATLRDGTAVRLLSYAVPAKSGFSVIQLGKPISEQVKLLNQFLTGLAFSGVVIVLLLGIGSWWVAGRSLQPTLKAWELQQTFIANASHELRTPLTLIRASSEVASRHFHRDKEMQGLLTDIMTECDHMSQLVEDLLLISKLDTHQLKLDRKPVDMRDLLEDIQRQFAPLAQKQSVKLELKNVDGVLFADRLRIRQVLMILVDNALRFTSSGGLVELDSSLQGRNVVVSIKDTGSGIPFDDLAHVFERFYQAGNHAGMDNKGNGLGLSIAKSLVEAHSGNIHIESRLGQGTLVTFSIPSSR